MKIDYGYKINRPSLAVLIVVERETWRLKVMVFFAKVVAELIPIFLIAASVVSFEISFIALDHLLK